MKIREVIETSMDAACPFCKAAAGAPCMDIDGEHAQFLAKEGLPDNVDWAHGDRIAEVWKELSVA